jgi:hypothetical protein
MVIGNPWTPVGFGIDLMLGSNKIGEGSSQAAISPTAVNSRAVPATIRHLGVSSRPFGKSSTMKRRTPVGKIR